MTDLSIFLKAYKEELKRQLGTKQLGARIIAAAIGVDEENYTKWEQGKNFPRDEESRKKIRNYFQVDDISKVQISPREAVSRTLELVKSKVAEIKLGLDIRVENGGVNQYQETVKEHEKALAIEYTAHPTKEDLAFLERYYTQRIMRRYDDLYGPKTPIAAVIVNASYNALIEKHGMEGALKKTMYRVDQLWNKVFEE